MPFPLSTFEAHISADIAKKGLNYFALGYVENLAEDRNTWAADVQGTHRYGVEIEITGGEVNDWSCDCPYDWDPVCKHVAAVMYAILEETLKEVAAPKTGSSELMALLKGAPDLWLLDRYYDLLAEGNQASFQILYSQKVREKMTHSSNRKAYRECCRYLKKIIKLGGKEEANLIAAEWRVSYPRRKAMDEELRKIGL